MSRTCDEGVEQSSMVLTTSAWFWCPNPRPQASLRLFCFPYAGSSARVYRDWAQALPPQIEVWAIELPGRGKRMAEPPFTQLEPLVHALAESLQSYLDKPFACFGHSLGGLIAFELARRLRHLHQPQPVHLWVSAACAPHLPATEPPIHALPDLDFMAKLRNYSGTPAPVLENAELMQLLLPTLRADFAVLETYHYRPDAPLTCPITALWGNQDPIVSQADVAPWEIHTQAAFSLTPISGDHFYVHQPQILHYLQPH